MHPAGLSNAPLCLPTNGSRAGLQTVIVPLRTVTPGPPTNTDSIFSRDPNTSTRAAPGRFIQCPCSATKLGFSIRPYRHMNEPMLPVADPVNGSSGVSGATPEQPQTDSYRTLQPDITGLPESPQSYQAAPDPMLKWGGYPDCDETDDQWQR